MKFTIQAVALGFAAVLGTSFSGTASAETIITLTQTGCQFVEPEGTDHNFKTMSTEDCKTINDEGGEKRLSSSEPLRLKPGKYTFRVTNENVPYTLGFYLRAANTLQVPFKPKTSGGGLHKGVTKDYVIELTEGEYIYSCPLNPTPDYPIIVSAE